MCLSWHFFFSLHLIFQLENKNIEGKFYVFLLCPPIHYSRGPQTSGHGPILVGTWPVRTRATQGMSGAQASEDASIFIATPHRSHYSLNTSCQSSSSIRFPSKHRPCDLGCTFLMGIIPETIPTPCPGLWKNVFHELVPGAKKVEDCYLKSIQILFFLPTNRTLFDDINACYQTLSNW